jgi:hypothetical protein
MRLVLLPVLLALTFLCACASSWDQGWVKPGASSEDYERERRECMQSSAQGRGSGQFGYDQPDQRLFESCMQQRGWQRDASK